MERLSDEPQRHPTVIDGIGRLVIPPETLAIHEGETLTLRVFKDRSLHCMLLSRPHPKQLPRNLRLERIAPHSLAQLT